MRPVIGVSSREFKIEGLPRIGTFRPYLEAVLDAGGAPVVIPLSDSPGDWVDAVMGPIDGLLLTGGEDIEPSRYGAAPHPKLETVSPIRDEVELALFRSARSRGIPVLGICRGLQFVNVACGGSLYQDLPTEYPEAKLHGKGQTGWLDASHSVEIDPRSLLGKISGVERLAINSLHHQAVRELGRELAVSGRCSTDGVVEAIEGTSGGWLLAVQWHPEVLWPTSEPNRSIFRAFVAACKKK